MQFGPLGSGLGNGPWTGNLIVPEVRHRQGNNAIVLVSGQRANHCFHEISVPWLSGDDQCGLESCSGD